MLTLVTQPDGSARRFPFVTLLLVVGMAYMLSQQWEGMRAARSEAQLLHAESVAYFHKNPFVAVDPHFEAQVGSELVEGVRTEFHSSRERAGMADVPARIQARSQQRFDGLVNAYRERFADIPAQRYGLRKGFEQPENLAIHAVVHSSLAAFVLSALLLLLVGIVLEDVWGSVVFAAFVGTATLASALAAVGLSSELWYGSCGIVGALLGAAVVRQFSEGSPRLLGAIPLPSWFLAGSWLLAEVGLTQAFGPELIAIHPPLPHLAAIGIGVLLGATVRAFGFEEVLAARWDDGESVNPVYDKAMELRERGKLDDAHQLLAKEYARDPKNRDIAVALWDVCRDRGEPEEAIGAARMVVEFQLREGATAAAAKQWIEISDQIPPARLELPAWLCARIADALIGEDEIERGLETLRLALSAKEQQPAAMVWVAQLANDHDRELARHAASIAYANPQLDASERATLIELVGTVEPDEFRSSASPGANAVPAQDAEDSAALDPGALDPDAFESDAFETEGGDFDALDGRALELSDDSDALEGSRPGGEPDLDALDPNALDPSAMDGAALDLDTQDDARSAGSADHASVDHGAVDLGGDDDLDSLDLDSDARRAEDPGSDELDPNALDLDDLDLEAAVDSDVPEEIFPDLDSEVETTPDIDPGALDSRALDPSALGEEAIAGPDLSDPESDGIAAEPLADLDPHDAPTELASPGEIPAPDLHEPVDAPTTPLIVDRRATRSVSQVTASPAAIGPEALTISLEDGRKLSVDWSRIDAIAVAAVGDLGSKPVVLIDLALNWSEGTAESLRVIRLRSDRFDPRPLTGVKDPLSALRALTQLLCDASSGVPLPDANAVAGQPFAMYDTLAGYEREVLLGVRH